MSETRITSLDVARLAGVSQSAVSRVFTKGASASKETVRKVRQAADELGYRPNVLARAMITGKSRIIGLVVAYLDNQFYPVALERLSYELQREGYHVLVFMAQNSTDGIDGVMQDLMDYQVDGIIAASVAMTSDLAERCHAAQIPVVLFNRGLDSAHLSSVTSNNRAGGRKVAEYLVAGGHTRIAHITGWLGSSTGQHRAEGFRAGLAEADVPLLAEIDGMFKQTDAQTAARSLMARSDPPDAIFVGNDHMAFAVMDTLRFELGLSVPDDVAIVGYDDTPLAAWPSYDLTTVRQPVNQMVEVTVQTMLAQIADPAQTTDHTEIDGPLIQRGSTRPIKGWAAE